VVWLCFWPDAIMQAIPDKPFLSGSTAMGTALGFHGELSDNTDDFHGEAL
jgi:hypothetical protein